MEKLHHTGGKILNQRKPEKKLTKHQETLTVTYVVKETKYYLTNHQGNIIVHTNRAMIVQMHNLDVRYVNI